MSKVQITGYSDDGIIVEGDCGDQYPGGSGYDYVHFDDGTVIEVGWCEVEGKTWSVDVHKLGEGASVKMLDPIVEDGEHYRDIMELEGNFTKCNVWGSPGGPTRDDINMFFEQFSPQDHKYETLKAAMEILS